MCLLHTFSLTMPVAFQMESNLLTDAQHHDARLFDDAYEAATNNEEPHVSPFSSNDGTNDSDTEKILDAAVESPQNCALTACPLCTLCELPLRELLNERANMGTQNNCFVRKRPFSMGYGFKNSKKIKYRSLREKTTPFPYTVWPW